MKELFVLIQIWKWFLEAVVFPIVGYIAVFAAIFIVYSLL